MDTLTAGWDTYLNRPGSYIAFCTTPHIVSHELPYSVDSLLNAALLAVLHPYTISSLQNKQENKTMCIQDGAGHFEQ
jgi:hypothetical protein